MSERGEGLRPYGSLPFIGSLLEKNGGNKFLSQVSLLQVVLKSCGLTRWTDMLSFGFNLLCVM